MWDLEVKVLRKVDSSVGAALNGEGIGDMDDVTDVGALVGGLPELFLGFGIVLTPCRCASLGATTSLRMTREPKTHPKKIRERQTRLFTTKQTNHSHALQHMDDRKPNGGLLGLIARTIVSLPLPPFTKKGKPKRPTNPLDLGNGPPPPPRRRLQARPASLPRHHPLLLNQHPPPLRLKRSLYPLLLQLCAPEQRGAGRAPAVWVRLSTLLLCLLHTRHDIDIDTNTDKI